MKSLPELFCGSKCSNAFFVTLDFDSHVSEIGFVGNELQCFSDCL